MNILLFKKVSLHFLRVRKWGWYMYYSVNAEVRRYLLGTGTLLLLCGSQGLSSGHQAWQQFLYLQSFLTSPEYFKRWLKSWGIITPTWSTAKTDFRAQGQHDVKALHPQHTWSNSATTPSRSIHSADKIETFVLSFLGGIMTFLWICSNTARFSIWNKERKK